MLSQLVRTVAILFVVALHATSAAAQDRATVPQRKENTKNPLKV
jgi:surface polysaccharide O-acyltransferase-like enzyme